MKKKVLLIHIQNHFEMTFQALREINITLQKLMDKQTTEILEKESVATVCNCFHSVVESAKKRNDARDLTEAEKNIFSLPVIVKCGVLPDLELTEAENLLKLSALKDRYDKMQEEKIDLGQNEKEFLKEQLGERKSAEGLWEGPDRPKQMTESENKAQVLAMRAESEAKKEAKISEAKNEREATNERERARCLSYNGWVLGNTDKSKEQNKSENEFEDTSEPEPYIQKEQSKEEEEADFLAVRKQIDGQLKGFRDKQNEYNASNQNGA